MPRTACVLLAVFAAGCGGRSAPVSAAKPRPFAMGFTDFPHARTPDAVNAALDVIRRDADLVVMHFDDGVPWEEAAAGTPYPRQYQADLERKAAAQPTGRVRYVAVTPIAFERDRLAPRRGDGGSEPLRPPWDGRAFDDPAVVPAFANHCERMIGLFAPDYFAYGIEVNLLRQAAPAKWPSFVRLAAQVYARLKAAHLTLRVLLTFQVEILHGARDAQSAAIREVLPYTDLAAASSYPYTGQSDPRTLAADHFDALASLAPGKRFAVAETGWPGEDVTAPYPVFIPASEEAQRLYVERLLADAERLDAAFVCWFLTRDFDAWWDAELKDLPSAPLVRLWRDIGLYRGDGSARPALDAWRSQLGRPRR